MRLLCALSLLAANAAAATHTYVIAVGNNAPPAGGDPQLRELHYADDDAAAAVSFFASLGAHTTLLTVLDESSARRFPDLNGTARPPTLAELRQTVAWHKQQIERDRARGDESTVLFFFSGHGSRVEGREPTLALLDGALTKELLYEEILAALPARYVHLFIDACYAEALVRPRDLQAQVVDVRPADLREYAARATLERFPQVGAVLASSSTAQTHEWDVYRQGVFSYEVLSGLRGAADVNGDGVVEYSELHAFLAAANREVGDERARLSVLVHPPAVNARAPIVDLRGPITAGRLIGAGSLFGWFVVEDARGNRLADLRAEGGWDAALTLPAEEDLYLRNHDREARLRLPRGGTVDARGLPLEPIATSARGSIESSLSRGLFAATYGPNYYRGFVDGREGFVPVPIETKKPAAPAATQTPDRRGAWASFGVAAGLGGAAAVFTGLAGKALSDFDGTTQQRQATDARDRFNVYEPLAITTAVLSAAGIVAGAIVYAKARPRAAKR